MNCSIAEIVAAREISPLFQPIIDASNQSLLGYEALARGPSDSVLHAPQRLFGAAAEAGLIRELDFLCFEAAIQRHAALGLRGRLFLNLTPTGLLALGNDIEFVVGTLALSELSPERLVLELTEQAIFEDYQPIREAMRKIRALGVSFAIDDLGAGYSNLRAWSELHPDYVKIDRYFVNSIDADPLKMEFVRAIVDMARAARSRVIAEGVETHSEAIELREAGVSFLQGFFISPPKFEPAPAVSDTMIRRVSIEKPRGSLTASDLLVEVEPIERQMSVDAVAARLRQQPDIQSLAVVENGVPCGIVRRGELLDLLSLPLRRELYGRKPIDVLMDKRPLLVDRELKLEQVSRLVTRGSRGRLHEQFVITENARYVGMGHVIDLLKRITEEQVQNARYSNPLTSLPGNVPIYDCVNDLLRRKRSFVLCYLDIDNFKPFNDYYGYSKGDEALISVGRELRNQVSPRIDFVGHIGGDDFVVVFRSPDWQDRITEAMRRIVGCVRSLYHRGHLQQGGLLSRDRAGVERNFPLLSVSVAALVCDAAPNCTAEDLAYMIAPIKARAKKVSGNALEIERYDNLVVTRRLASA